MFKCPYRPDQAGYTATYGNELIAVKLDGGLSRQRRDIVNAAHSFSVRWTLSREKYEEMMNFYRAYVRTGGAPFAIDLILDDYDIDEYVAKIIPETWKLVSITGITYVISCELEVEYKDVDSGHIALNYEENGNITGSTYWRGRKIGNVPITAQFDNRGVVYTTTSNANGDFIFNDLRILPGTHIFYTSGPVSTDYDTFNIYGQIKVVAEGTLVTVVVKIEDLNKPLFYTERGALLSKLYIDYGDGDFRQEFRYGTDGDIYTMLPLIVGNEYTITILGLEIVRFYNIYTNKPNTTNPLMELIKVVSPTMINMNYFAREQATLRKIHDGVFLDSPALQTAASSFYGCSGLTEVPDNLFANLTAMTTFTSTFQNCINLPKINDTMFINCTAAKDFSNCFDGCSELLEIPENLFASCINATAFKYVFQKNIKLVGIPANLFKYNTKALTFEYAFNQCTKIASIPAGLFDNQTLVTTFNNCFEFGNGLTSIPNNLFSKCVNATSFKYCFASCYNILTIGNNLFSGCTSAVDFSYCFYGGYLISTIGTGIFNNCSSATNFTSCFENCERITTIPANIFDSCVNATTFASTFAVKLSGKESRLVTIPTGIFKFNTKVVNVGQIFWKTNAQIPAGLFEGLSLLTDVSNAFYNAKLANIPANTFNGCSSITSLNHTFYYCASLPSIPAGLFASCTNVGDITNLFGNGLLITTAPDGLFNSSATKLNKLDWVFQNCPRLNSNINGIFSAPSYPAVTTLNEAFSGCSQLTGAGNSFIVKVNANSTHVGTLRGCVSLSDYASIPAGWK